MTKLILSCLFGIFILSNTGHAIVFNVANPDVPDVKNKKIGVFNRFDDYTTLVYTEIGFRKGYKETIL